MEAMTEKIQRNARVQTRYDELCADGKHGHYETMFRVVREEVQRERERCAQICEGLATLQADAEQLAYAIRKGP